jgi:hypothetical protein
MPGSRTNSTAADGVEGKTKPSRAEPPAQSGAGQGGHGSPKETSTYHSREAEAEGAGGRFAAETPRVGWDQQPPAEWSEDLSGIEPPIDGRGESSVLGYRIHGDDHDPA